MLALGDRLLFVHLQTVVGRTAGTDTRAIVFEADVLPRSTLALWLSPSLSVMVPTSFTRLADSKAALLIRAAVRGCAMARS